jgi:hypothetical protein
MGYGRLPHLPWYLTVIVGVAFFVGIPLLASAVGMFIFQMAQQ